MGGFSAEIARFARESEDRNRQILRATALEVFRRIVQRSPVDTGRFKGNWIISDSEISYREGMGPRFDAKGALALTAGQVQIKARPDDRPYLIANGLPYGPRLEYGWSKQAPAGMVRITAVEFPGILAKITAAVQAGKL